MGLGTGVMDTRYSWVWGKPYDQGDGDMEIASQKNILVLVAGSGLSYSGGCKCYVVGTGGWSRNCAANVVDMKVWCDAYKILCATQGCPRGIWGSLMLWFTLWKRKGWGAIWKQMEERTYIVFFFGIATPPASEAGTAVSSALMMSLFAWIRNCFVSAEVLMVSGAWMEAQNQALQSPLASNLLLNACINFRNLHLKFLCSLEITKLILITCPPFPGAVPIYDWM